MELVASVVTGAVFIQSFLPWGLGAGIGSCCVLALPGLGAHIVPGWFSAFDSLASAGISGVHLTVVTFQLSRLALSSSPCPGHLH